MVLRSAQVLEASKWAVAGDSEGGVNSSYCEDGLSLKPAWKEGRRQTSEDSDQKEGKGRRGTCTWRASRCGRQIAANNDINAHTREAPHTPSLPLLRVSQRTLTTTHHNQAIELERDERSRGIRKG